MRWLSDNNAYIEITRRWWIVPECGIEDVYQLYMDVKEDGKFWQWSMYIAPHQIKKLQEFIKMGIAAFKKLEESNV